MSFNNSFVSALPMGAKAYQDYLANQRADEELGLRKAAAARDAERWDQEKSDRDSVDAAFRGYAGLESNGVVANNNTGISDQGLAALNRSGGKGMVTEAMRIANEENAGMGLAPQYQMPAEGAAPQYTTRTATGLERNAAMSKIAAAKRDAGMMRDLGKERVGLEFDEGYRTHIKAFNDMKPEARAAIMEKATADHGFPLNMVPSSGKDKNGKPTYTTWIEGKPRFQLGEAEVADIYAAQQMMATHPDLARARLENSTKNVRELFKQYVELTDKQLDTNNQATRYGHLDANDAARLGLEGQRVKLDKARAEREKWSIVGATDDNKGLLYFDQSTGKTEIKPLPPGTDAKGLFAKITGASSKPSPEFEKLPEDGVNVKDARGNVYTYREGVPLLQGGVPPSQQSSFYTKNGFPAQAESMVRWLPGGRHVQVPGLDGAYDMANPSDVAAVREAITATGARLVEGQEAEARGRGVLDPRDARVAAQPDPLAPYRANAMGLRRSAQQRGQNVGN
jgi:hypothetical protein